MKYKIIYQEESQIKILKVNDLENLPKNIIKIKEQRVLSNFQFKHTNRKNILYLFEQLSIMLNANIMLSEAIDLSLKIKQEKIIKEILEIMKNSISNGLPLDKALQKYEHFLGEVTILFLKLGIENGNVKQSINSLVQLLQEDMKIKTKFDDTLRYPKLLIISLIFSLGMVFLYVVPNFEYIFTMSQNEIPLSTQILLSLNNLLKEHFYLVFFGIISVGLLLYYGIYKRFTVLIHKFIILQLPLVNQVLKDYYFYRLFLLISIIVNSKYQFQVAIENSTNVIPNLYIKRLIQTIISDVKNGVAISSAFEKTKLFDPLTIQLLFAAEHTASYETILQDIANYYKQKFQDSLKIFSSYIEPIIILSIASVVLWLMLAIMLPIWNMSSFLS